MTPPPPPTPVATPAGPAEAGSVLEPDSVAPEAEERAELFRWMSWSAAIAMNA